MARKSFTLSGGVGFANAVRRALTTETKMWAPMDMEFDINTSAHSDEYLAHRVGLIPFRRVGVHTELVINAQGPCTVYAADLRAPAGGGFEAIHPHIEVARLGTKQTLRAVVRFKECAAKRHARFCPCAAVAMCDDGDAHAISFETIDASDHSMRLKEAIDSIDEMCDDALLQIETTQHTAGLVPIVTILPPLLFAPLYDTLRESVTPNANSCRVMPIRGMKRSLAFGCVRKGATSSNICCFSFVVICAIVCDTHHVSPPYAFVHWASRGRKRGPCAQIGRGISIK